MNNTTQQIASDVVVSLKNVSKVYGLYPSPSSRLKEALHPFRKKYHRNFFALRDITLEIRKGEILGVIGVNGSGKSTLLKVISKIFPPTSGAVNSKGDIVALLELASAFNPEFTGLQNVYFYGSILGFKKTEMDERLDDILSFADIGEFISQPLRIYSAGMKLRLAFAVCTNIDPEILVLDEILAVGDELFQRKCYARMEEFFAEGKTILLASHSVRTILELCSRAVLLDAGELILEGRPKIVTDQYQRYLYSNPQEAPKIREEMKRINEDSQIKERLETRASESGDIEKQTITSIKSISYHATSPKGNKQRPYFAQDLQPQSTVEYKNYDVEIYDIHIRTLAGEKVNVLVVNDEYIYTYKVGFNLDVENVNVTMKFKTEKGLPLGWDVAPGKDKFIEKVKKGEEYLVEWFFRCNLLEGNYYTNLAVQSVTRGKRIFLNRIVDALVFKVQKNMEQNYGGLVHFDQAVIITKLE